MNHYEQFDGEIGMGCRAYILHERQSPFNRQGDITLMEILIFYEERQSFS